jgi:hypothetical protein
VDLNPVRAGMVKRPQDWAWSSYRAHSGRIQAPAWLDSTMLYSQLAPSAERSVGPRRYAQFVAQGHGVKLWEGALRGQIYLGGDAFVQRMQAFAASDVKEIPQSQRRFAARPLQWYFDRHDRNIAITQAFMEGGYTQSAIAQETGLSVARISRLIKAVEAKGKT